MPDTKTFLAERIFGNGSETFNKLSPMPSGPIDLGDGRRLNIKRWVADGDEKCYGGANYLDVRIEGFIEMIIKKPLPTDPAPGQPTQPEQPEPEISDVLGLHGQPCEREV